MATLYFVLREVSVLPTKESLMTTADAFTAYERVGEVEAAGALAAIRSLFASEARAPEPGVYVAVPARSWTEQEVALEQKPRVVLSDPKAKPKLVAAEGGSAPARAEAKADSS